VYDCRESVVRGWDEAGAGSGWPRMLLVGDKVSVGVPGWLARCLWEGNDGCGWLTPADSLNPISAAELTGLAQFSPVIEEPRPRCPATPTPNETLEDKGWE
jgi:hypothetical protein